MFVPFDQLYNFLDQRISTDTLIYLFAVPGDRKISNIKIFRDYAKPDMELMNSVLMFMHDQEPLHYDLYKNSDIGDLTRYVQTRWKNDDLMPGLTKSHMINYYSSHSQDLNFFLDRNKSIYDKWLLCHSEINSQNLIKYQSIGAVGVYWWSHAMIARDWYRFALVDKKLQYNNHFFKSFNVYNRAWQGSREYRLKFTELMVLDDLVKDSLIKFSPIENNNDYRNHKFCNTDFSINTTLDHLPVNNSQSCSSADYSASDYQTCAIDVVLETLFDDDRIHLTEKILRPIACGKPFVLASTAGSLQYLKNYGFETFGELIDESYDKIKDPLQRLQAIIKVLKDISQMTNGKKTELFSKMHEIAYKNQTRFWSNEFIQQILNEFDNNFQAGHEICQQSTDAFHWKRQRLYFYNASPACRQILTAKRQDIVKLFKKIKSLR